MADPPYDQLRELQSTDSSEAPNDSADPFQYPQIFVETSFDTLLHHSYPSHPSSSQATMREVHGQQGTGSSLSESWASISDAELSQDDDLRSEKTDTGSLVDIHSADDILSVREEDASAADEEEEPEEEPEEETPSPHDHPSAQYTSRMETSECTPAAGTSLTETSLLPNHITLDEHDASLDGENVFVRHTLEVFKSADPLALGFDRSVVLSEPIGSIQLGLSKSTLRDTGRQSLRMLMLGKDYLPSLRSSVVGKIADALVASGSAFDNSPPNAPSRYHVVPDCFGPGSTPSTAEVIPIDCQLEVDSYQSAEFLDSMHQSIALFDESSSKVLRSERYHDGFSIRGQEGSKPDLAVVVVSSKDTSDQTDKVCIMLIFAQRHSIPVLAITVDEDWSADFVPLVFAKSSAHRCIEDLPVRKGGICRQLPLDLNTLLSLNPAQLSRHLSYLVDSPGNDKERNQKPERTDVLLSDDASSRKYIQKPVRVLGVSTMWERVKRCSPLSPMLLILICALLVNQFCVSLLAYQKTGSTLANDTVAVRTSGVPTLASSLLNTSRTVVAVPTGLVDPHVPLTIDATKSTTGKFEVEVVGNSHLIVRTPHEPKKTSLLDVIVLRDEDPVQIEVNPLFPCVYSVHITKEQLYGKLDIQLAMTHPHVVDNIKLDLGPQPLDVWIRSMIEETGQSVRQSLIRLQGSLQKRQWSEGQQKVIQHAQDTGFALSRQFKAGQKRLDFCRARLAAFDAKREAFNRRMDVRGAALLNNWIGSLKQSRAINDVLSKVTAVRHRMDGFDLRHRFQQAAHNLHDNMQSDTLATAQDRAQHIVKEWRHRMGRRRGL